MNLEAATLARSALAAMQGQNVAAAGVSTANGVSSSNEAAVVSLSGSLSVAQVENHIVDYRSGRGYLSQGVGIELRKQDQENAIGLNPKDGLLYSTVSGLGGYGNYARLANSVGGARNAASAIAAAPARAEATTKEIKRIFGYDK